MVYGILVRLGADIGMKLRPTVMLLTQHLL